MKSIRVAFAGLAHSHPFSDAANLAALRDGGEALEFVGVFDTEPSLAEQFAERFACTALPDLDGLAESAPDLVIATPRPHETADFASRLLASTDAQLFFNKVVAGSATQLAEWEAAITAAPHRVGTSSVLRFAPALRKLAAGIVGAELWGIRVLAQHDIGMFLTPERLWQDDPARGGGTLVTAGLHAWEMIGAVLPGAILAGDISGWIHRSPGSASRSEESAQLSGTLARPSGTDVPFSITVTGTPGPEVYAVDVFTSNGTHSVSLAFPHPRDSLGFTELVAELIQNTRLGIVTAPWESARPIVSNTIRAAQALRGIHYTEKSQR